MFKYIEVFVLKYVSSISECLNCYLLRDFYILFCFVVGWLGAVQFSKYIPQCTRVVMAIEKLLVTLLAISFSDYGHGKWNSAYIMSR